MSNENTLQRIKITTISERGCGKTSLIYRYVDNIFGSIIQSKIGIDFLCKNLNEIKADPQLRLMVWDGHGYFNRFENLRAGYYRSSHGHIILYDVTNRESFEQVQFWLDDHLKKCRTKGNTLFAIVGSKCDLEEERQVTYREGQEIANSLGIIFYEVSSKTSQNVDTMFQELVSEIMNNCVAKHVF